MHFGVAEDDVYDQSISEQANDAHEGIKDLGDDVNNWDVDVWAVLVSTVVSAIFIVRVVGGAVHFNVFELHLKCEEDWCEAESGNHYLETKRMQLIINKIRQLRTQQIGSKSSVSVCK